MFSKDGCDVPALISASNDTRCVSFALGNFTLKT